MGDKYTKIGLPLGVLEISRIYGIVENSELFELPSKLPDGRLSHIVRKGTAIPVGYVGDDTLELVNKGEEELKPDHNHLIEIYNHVTKSKIPKIE